VHKRLWPALVRLSGVIGRRRLGAIREEHTSSGAHRLLTAPFPSWVPPSVERASEKVSEAQARELLRVCLADRVRGRRGSPGG
jgi:hypothetical protein